MEANAIEQQQKSVSVHVNKKLVKLGSATKTGLEIKRTAISQGVAIKLTFSLFIIHGHDEVPVRDDEEVAVKEGEQFKAVAPDDNS